MKRALQIASSALRIRTKGEILRSDSAVICSVRSAPVRQVLSFQHGKIGSERAIS
jgi:hypothetical protein